MNVLLTLLYLQYHNGAGVSTPAEAPPLAGFNKISPVVYTHDSTEYLDKLEEMEVDIQKKHYLIEVYMEIAEILQENARKKEISVSYLANELLHKQLAEAV